MDLKGTAVLVTGGNRGIGRAIVGELAARGADVLAGVRELDTAAIEGDEEQLNPGGGEWLAKLAPKRLLDAAAKRGFDR